MCHGTPCSGKAAEKDSSRQNQRYTRGDFPGGTFGGFDDYRNRTGAEAGYAATVEIGVAVGIVPADCTVDAALAVTREADVCELLDLFEAAEGGQGGWPLRG